MDQKAKEARYKEYLKRRQELDTIVHRCDERISSAQKAFNESLAEMDRVADVAHNTKTTLEDLDKAFSKCTRLDTKDYDFLFLAVALQCLRWFLQPKIEVDFQKIAKVDRHDAGADGRKIDEALGKKKASQNNGSVKSKRYPDSSKMYILPVPYDAMEGTERIIIPGVSDFGSNLYARNHHAATLGHDPVIGLLMGPINIMTRTISFKNATWQTCEVHLKREAYLNPEKSRGQYVTVDITKTELIRRFLESLQEEPKRILAAEGRHLLHLESDKYCTQGLPIPFISAEKAQNLLEDGWNSYELERLIKYVLKDVAIIGTQVGFSAIINTLIEYLHKLCYDNSLGISKDIYSVKTQKILEISNIIASSSNLLAVAFTNDLRKLDIGGLCNTLYSICKSHEIQNKIKDKFIYGSYYDMIRGNI